MPVDWGALEGLARQSVDGVPGAWPEFLRTLEQALAPFWRRMPIGRLKDREDDRRNIATAMFEKLHRDDLGALRGYFAAAPRPPFRAWIHTVFVRTGIDYQRGHDEYVRAPAAAATSRPRWRELVSLRSSAPGARPAVTDEQLVREMLDFLDEGAGDARRARYRRGVELWLADRSDDEIAAELQLAGAKEARNLVRAALAVLRRRFQAEDTA